MVELTGIDIRHQQLKVETKKSRPTAKKPEKSEARDAAVKIIKENPPASQESLDALKTMREAAEPTDHTEQIYDVADKFKTGEGSRSKSQHEKQEAAEQQKFLEKSHLYNDYLTFGYDNMPAAIDDNGKVIPGQRTADRQQALRNEIVHALEVSGDHDDLLNSCRKDPKNSKSKYEPDKISRLAERYLKGDTPDVAVVRAKLERKLDEALKSERFSSRDPDAKKAEIKTAQKEVRKAQEPVTDITRQIEAYEEEIKKFEANGDYGKQKHDLENYLGSMDDPKKTQLEEAHKQAKENHENYKIIPQQFRDILPTDPNFQNVPALYRNAILENIKVEYQLRKNNEPYNKECQLAELTNREKGLRETLEQLNEEKEKLKETLQDAKKDQRDVERSQAHDRTERVRLQKQLNKKLSNCLGSAVVEHERFESAYIDKQIEEQTQVEQARLDQIKEQANKDAVAGVDKYLDTIFRQPKQYREWADNELFKVWRQATGSIQAEGGLGKSLKKLGKQAWEAMVYEGAEGMNLKKPETPPRLENTERVYRQILDTDSGIDDVLKEFRVGGNIEIVNPTPPPDKIEKPKTYADLGNSPEDIKLKSLLRGEAIGHTAKMRYELSKKAGEATPRTISDEDMQKIVDRSWFEDTMRINLEMPEVQEALKAEGVDVTPQDVEDLAKKKPETVNKFKEMAKKGGKAFLYMLLGTAMASQVLSGLLNDGSSNQGGHPG